MLIVQIWPILDYRTFTSPLTILCIMLRTLFVTALVLLSFVSRAGLPLYDPWGELKFMTEEYPPLNFIDANGNLTGLSVEVLLGTAKHAKSGLSREDILVLPWARAYKATLKRKGRVLFATSRKPERESLFLWVGPISEGTPSFLIARKTSNINIISSKDLMKYRIGVIRGDSLEKRVEKLKIPSENIIRSHDPELLAQQLIKGRIDLWATNWTGAKTLLEELNVSTTLIEPVYKFKFNDNYFAVNKTTPIEIVNKMQAALDAFKKTPEYKLLVEKFK